LVENGIDYEQAERGEFAVDGPIFREGEGRGNGFWQTDYRDGGISEGM